MRDKPFELDELIKNCKSLSDYHNSVKAANDNVVHDNISVEDTDMGDVLSLSINELRNLVIEYRKEAQVEHKRLVDEERDRIEKDVLHELIDHPTVDYIRMTEDERDRYRDAYVKESKKLRDTAIALQSKDRIISKLQDQMDRRYKHVVTANLNSNPSRSRPQSAPIYNTLRV